MEKLTLSQWWGVLSDYLKRTKCTLFEAVTFMIDKYGEPKTKDNVLQNFEECTELD